MKFDDSLIENGIVFIWIPKGHIGEMMDYFVDEGFMYVENFMFTLLDRKKIPEKKKTTISKYSLDHYFKNTTK